MAERPSSQLPAGDLNQPRSDVDRETILRILAVPIDAGLAAQLDTAEAPVDDPWPPETL